MPDLPLRSCMPSQYHSSAVPLVFIREVLDCRCYLKRRHIPYLGRQTTGSGSNTVYFAETKAPDDNVPFSQKIDAFRKSGMKFAVRSSLARARIVTLTSRAELSSSMHEIEIGEAEMNSDLIKLSVLFDEIRCASGLSLPFHQLGLPNIR